MVEGRKYILNESCGLLVGPTKFPEVYSHPENDYETCNGIGIGMQVHLRDADVDPVVVMDRRQLKEIIRYLRRAYRESRKYMNSRSKQSL